MPERAPLAVVLTGGRATRLRPLSLELPKALVPVLNRPLVAYALDRLPEVGITEAVLVVTPGDTRTAPIARQYAPRGLTIDTVVQPHPKGPGDALAQVPRARLQGRRVAVIAADALLWGGDLSGHFRSWAMDSVDSWLVLATTDRPHSMGIAQIDGERVTHFVEKPERPLGNLASVGWWLLGPAAVSRVLDRPVVNIRGEVEISGTLARAIEEQLPVGGREFDGEWLDTGTLAALLVAQARLLGGRGVPALVAADALVEDCDLGPNVVVGSRCELRGVRLSNALVAAGAVLSNLDDHDVVIAPSGRLGRPA